MARRRKLTPAERNAKAWMKARANVYRSLVLLPTREADMVRLRYGFGGQPPATLDAIASTFDLTRQRVHQILDETLRHLRENGVTESMIATAASLPGGGKASNN